MNETLQRVVLLFLLLAGTVPFSLLSLSLDHGMALKEPFALCHRQVPLPSPGKPNHDCCLVGHDHSVPAYLAVVRPIFVAGQNVVSMGVKHAGLLARIKPAVCSLDPPADLALRI